MRTHDENKYIGVKDDRGEDYLCPMARVKDRTAVSEDELRECVELDVVGRYSGNIEIEN